MNHITIRLASADEQPHLLDLQWRASLTHDAYRELLLQHPEAADLPVSHVEDGNTMVAEVDGLVAGFAVVLRISESEMELDALFVEPEYSGTGIGRYLVRKASRCHCSDVLSPMTCVPSTNWRTHTVPIMPSAENFSAIPR